MRNMPHAQPIVMTAAFVWSAPQQGMKRHGIDVSSRSWSTYNKFSPFYHHTANAIPVPGSSMRADSVEGIWQGLKIIGGKPDLSLFQGPPRKRKGHVEGHVFGDVLLDYRDARAHIFVPAYAYHAINNVLDDVADDLEVRAATNDVALYDVEMNGDIDDLTSPYSHAALLVDILNLLKDAPLPPFSKQHFPYLQDQVEAIVSYRRHLDENERALLDDIVTFAYLFSPQDVKQACALHAIRQGVPHQGRLAHYTPCASTAALYDAVRR